MPTDMIEAAGTSTKLTVNEFRRIERFLDKLPNTDNNNNKYDYAIA